MVSAVILAGGLGIRLRPRVPSLPKALAPIQGVPFLQILLQQLERSAMISQVIMALGHKAIDIQKFFLKKNYPFQVEFSVESSSLGTGGALLQALRKTSAQTLLVLNGDSFSDLSLPNFFSFHRQKGADITIACKKVDHANLHGACEIDVSSQHILSFQKRSSISQPGWINAGPYFIERDLLSSFPQGVYSIEKDFFPHFLKKKIMAYLFDGLFIDIGTVESYKAAQEILKPWIN